MSDHLTEGWPLGPTSTVYMNGKSVYHIRQYGKPGIFASVELRQDDAEAIRMVVEERIREVREEAYDEGGKAAIERENTYGAEEKAKFNNPYRSES